MAEHQCYEKECRFRLVLFWYGGVHTSYDAKAGVKQSLHLKGRIYDPYVDFWGDPSPTKPASAFHDNPVALSISSPGDSKWLKRFRT